ncbi:alpha/beta hydrolase [Rhodobacteraceae bacterium F11138]|nr:alpha/beta hydrolase [Rhodobacteraceae bacterium F11138]
MIHPLLEASLNLSREDLDHQLSPSLTAKDANAALAGQMTATKAALVDNRHCVSPDLAYGPRPRQRLDIFKPLEAVCPLPCLMFIHGGFWQEGSKEVSGFAAHSFTSQGWAYTSVGYTLTPEVTLTELTAEVHDAVAFIHANAARFGIDPSRIIIAGHSAGGHLTASILTDLLGKGVGDKIAGAVAISAVVELEPIAKSYVNDLTRMSESEVANLSPARLPPQRDVPVHIVVGGDEPEAFQLQSDLLAEHLQGQITDLTFCRAAGRDHFDILDVLADPESETFQTILSMAQQAVNP